MFGEHNNILLTEDESLKLQTNLGLEKYNKCLDKLSNYKLANNKKYKSDYGAINSWVIESINSSKSITKKTRGEVNDERMQADLRAKGIFTDVEDSESALLAI